MKNKYIDLYPGNIYKYVINNNNFIGIYLCKTNSSKKVCIIPINLKKTYIKNDSVYELESYKMFAYPYDMLEIDYENIYDILRIKGKVAKISYREYITLSNHIIKKLTSKIENTFLNFSQKRFETTNTENYSITESYYKYLTWFERKSNLEFERSIKRNPIIKKYCLYYAEIGENIGSELHKMRPVLIFKCLKSSNPNNTSYMVIPVTSQSSAKYSFNTPIVVNGKINYVRTNDIRRISIKRIVSPLFKTGTNEIIKLTSEEIIHVKENFKNYFIN